MTNKTYRRLITYTERLADTAHRLCMQLNNIESRVDPVEFASVTRSLGYAQELLKAGATYLYKPHETTTVLLLEGAVAFMYALKHRIVSLAAVANAGKEEKGFVDFAILLGDMDYAVGRIRNTLCSDASEELSTPSVLPMRKFDSVESMKKFYAKNAATEKNWDGTVGTLEKALIVLGNEELLLPGGKHQYTGAYKKVVDLFTAHGWKLALAGPLVVFWAELQNGARSIDFTSWEEAGSRIHGNGDNIPPALKED